MRRTACIIGAMSVLFLAASLEVPLGIYAGGLAISGLMMLGCGRLFGLGRWLEKREDFRDIVRSILFLFTFSLGWSEFVGLVQFVIDSAQDAWSTYLVTSFAVPALVGLFVALEKVTRSPADTKERSDACPSG